MYKNFYKNKEKTTLKKLQFGLIVTLACQLAFGPLLAQAQTITDLHLPAPGSLVTQSAAYDPLLLKAITINADNPFQFDFIIDRGHSALTGFAMKEASRKLIKYFMTSLTIPESELWVNLSPYEDDRIIAQNFGFTEMGRDLLAQDYVLKQLTSSLIHPNKELGETFWENVYAKISQQYCEAPSLENSGKDCDIQSLTVDTFNKVWVVPERALVYEHGQTAFVAESYLKVLLESDYEAMRAQHKKNQELTIAQKEKDPRLSDLASEIVRTIIIPEIEKEVNQGEHFAQLRQITHSLILASWYKKRLKESILAKVYVDKGKVPGVDVLDRDIKNKIYAQYIEAFTKGAFNVIKEDYDPVTNQVIPRKYFSGGKDYTALSQTLRIADDFAMVPETGQKEINKILQKTQEGTDIFTVKANFEVKNSYMQADAYATFLAKAQELAGYDLNEKPMSAFVEWMDETLNSLDTELTQEQMTTLAQQLDISENMVQRIYADTNKMANRAFDFSRRLPQDEKNNVFLMRDAFSLYAASRLLGDKAHAFYLSKATFRMVTKIAIMADLLIPQMIMETKRRMSIAKTSSVSRERFPEFKQAFFTLLEELVSDQPLTNLGQENQNLTKVRDNIRAAINSLTDYLNNLGLSRDVLAKDGIRFIDTTKTGSFVLFLEGVARLMIKETGLLAQEAEEKTDGRMFFSDLSEAFSYREDISLNDAREIESTFYPVSFARSFTENNEPIISATDSQDQKHFLFQLALLQSELFRIRNEPENRIRCGNRWRRTTGRNRRGRIDR